MTMYRRKEYFKIQRQIKAQIRRAQLTDVERQRRRKQLRAQNGQVVR